MPFETITSSLSARGVATITLNRPDRSNAINQTMLNEVGAQLSDLAHNEDARVIVLGANGKHFCAGVDIGQTQVPANDVRQYSLHEVLNALDTQPQPTLAIVQGAAVGGGAGLVACCDVSLASETAFFSIPEVRIGMPPVRLARYLIRAMGYHTFRRYGLSGERMGSAEAMRAGLIHEVCEATKLDTRAAEVVDALLHGAPRAVRELKQAIADFAAPPIPSLDDDPTIGEDLRKRPEAIEGVASFREKRKPSWYPAPG